MKKFRLLLFNIIIIGISAVCLAGFMTMSFWRVTLTVPLDSSTISEFFGEEAEGIDLSQVPNDIEFSLTFEVTPATLRGVLAAEKDGDRVRSIIEPIVDDFFPQVNVVIKKLVSAVVRTGVSQAMTQLEETLGEESREKIKEVDVEEIGEIMDKTFAGEIPNDIAREQILEFLKDKIDEMEIPEEDKTAALTAIDENLEDMFEEHFAEVTNDEGFVDPARTVEMMFAKMLKLEGDEFSSDALVDRIVEKMGEKQVKNFALGMKVFAAIWIVVSAVWALLLLFAVIALVRGRGARLWYVCLLGWIPGVLLFALPTIGLKLVSKLLAEGAAIFNLFSISFMSLSGVLSLIGIVALIVLCILGYRRTRKAAAKAAKAGAQA